MIKWPNRYIYGLISTRITSRTIGFMAEPDVRHFIKNNFWQVLFFYHLLLWMIHSILSVNMLFIQQSFSWSSCLFFLLSKLVFLLLIMRHNYCSKSKVMSIKLIKEVFLINYLENTELWNKINFVIKILNLYLIYIFIIQEQSLSDWNRIRLKMVTHHLFPKLN